MTNSPRKRITFRLLSYLCWLMAFHVASNLQAAGPAAKDDSPSIGRPTPSDLDSGLLDDIKLPPKQAETDASPENPESPQDARSAESNSPSTTSPDDPFTLLRQAMETAAQRMRGNDTSKETQDLQREIVASLDRLIRKLEQQKQGGSASQSQSNSNSNQQQTGAEKGTGEAESQGPVESTDRLDQAETTLAALERQRALVEQMNWGNLPERLRKQLQSGRSGQFLPKYAKMIEDYYKRLAEPWPVFP